MLDKKTLMEFVFKTGADVKEVSDQKVVFEVNTEKLENMLNDMEGVMKQLAKGILLKAQDRVNVEVEAYLNTPVGESVLAVSAFIKVK